MNTIHILPHSTSLPVPTGENLLSALRAANLAPDAPCGGNGKCGKCKVLSSMEGYGLFVAQVCRDAGVPYYYGERTIAYTACVLF